MSVEAAMLQVMPAEKWRLMREEILPAYEKSDRRIKLYLSEEISILLRSIIRKSCVVHRFSRGFGKYHRMPLTELVGAHFKKEG